MAGIFCPTCGKVVPLSNIAVSDGAVHLRCRTCGTPLEWPNLKDPNPSEAKSADTAARPGPARSRNTFLVIALCVCVAASITALAIVLARNTSPAGAKSNASSAQQTWDAQNYEKIIALKNEAEALAIQGKLAEAHAKYREIEKLVGGRTVKEPSLMDTIDQSRSDQDRIYAILLRSMEEQIAAPAPGGPTAPTAAPENLPPTEPYPKSIDPPIPNKVEVVPSEPATTTPVQTAAAPPATTTATEPATTPAVASTGPSDPVVSTEVTTPVDQALQNFPRGTVPPVTPISDAEVELAIRKGVDFLYSQFKNGVVDLGGKTSDTELAGIDGLCVYALLQCSQSINDQRISIKGDFMKSAIEKLKAMKIETGNELIAPVTYGRSLRAVALAVYDRPEDHKQLEADVAWLINAAVHGAYTYDDRYVPKTKRYDGGASPRTRNDQPVDDGRAPIILVDGIRGGGRTYIPSGRNNNIPSVRPGTNQPQPGGRPPAQTTPGRPGYAPGRPGTNSPGRPFIPTNPRIFGRTLPGTFVPPKEYPVEFPWDNSNSQYGLLGVWAGAETGIEVPLSYWTDVERHWTQCQLPDGQWYYRQENREGRVSMTLAAIASLFVTHDYIDAPALGGKRGVSREPYGRALQAGLDWLETGNNSVDILNPPDPYLAYKLFGLERVALASGMKHLGVHDWYAELAKKVMQWQTPSGAFKMTDGATSDNLIDTAYVLAFLVRGRHPIMMNKLRFNDYWTNRPREIANLSKDVTKELERPINWQVVDLLREPWEWEDSPILYIASHHDVKFTDDDIGKLIEFVDDGGILFTHADNSTEEFNKFAAALAKKMFPSYELKDLPSDHLLYTVNKNIKLPRPKLRGVSNGSRLLMVHSPTDLSNAWQMRASMSRKEAFDVGGNLYVYATGKEQFRNRLDSTAVPVPPEVAAKKAYLARLKYQGNWDPEPGAWPRFAKRFQWLTETKLEVATMELKEMDFDEFPLAHLCGIDAFTPSDEEQKRIKKYVEEGGTLLIDTIGGSGKFTDSTTAWIAALFGPDALQPLDPASPILKGGSAGMTDVSKPILRLYAIEKIGNAPGRLKSLAFGKGKVIVSSLDIASGLLGTCTWGILGYTPEYSESLAKNIILSTNP